MQLEAAVVLLRMFRASKRAQAPVAAEVPAVALQNEQQKGFVMKTHAHLHLQYPKP